MGYTIKNSFLFLFYSFLSFNLFPFIYLFTGRMLFFIRKNIGMSSDQLLSNCFDNIIKLKRLLFLCDLRQEYYLKQKVSQFLFQVSFIGSLYCICNFISFFNRVRSNGFKGLLFVPFATIVFVSQQRHDLEEFFYVTQFSIRLMMRIYLNDTRSFQIFAQ